MTSASPTPSPASSTSSARSTTMEGRVELFELGRKPSLADELAGIEKDARVEEELAELKARLGNGPRPMPAR